VIDLSGQLILLSAPNAWRLLRRPGSVVGAVPEQQDGAEHLLYGGSEGVTAQLVAGGEVLRGELEHLLPCHPAYQQRSDLLQLEGRVVQAGQRESDNQLVPRHTRHPALYVINDPV
jgi:hypothetical protein